MVNKMEMKQYLIDSGRTAQTLEQVDAKMYENDHSLLHDIGTLIVNGNQADLMKRSIFYREPIAKTEERANKFNNEMDDFYLKLRVALKDNPEKRLTPKQIDIIHAALGAMSEAAETLNEVALSFLDNRDMDIVNLKEECGDKMWYLALEMRALETDFETEGSKNIHKLAIRFPDKFNSEDALNRDYEKEKVALT